MKFLTYSLSLLGVLFIFNSCAKDEIVNQVQLNETTKEINENYLSQPKQIQKQIWIDRLESYKNLSLTIGQKAIVEDIIEDLNNIEEGEFYISNSLRENAIKMAKITPQDDFINLFNKINKEPHVTNLGEICEVCIIDLENPNSYLKMETISDAATLRENPDCDCNWTCADPLEPCEELLEMCSSSDQTGCCEESYGCGLFNMGSCTGAVVDTGDC